MSGKFVDTNILLYAHDRSAGSKHERALSIVRDLWSSGDGIISTQVLQEFALNLQRKVEPALSFEDVRLRVVLYSEWSVVTNTPASVVGALEQQRRFNVSFWDALIIEAANRSGADVLYSEDLRNGEYYGSVRVVDPLK